MAFVQAVKNTAGTTGSTVVVAINAPNPTAGNLLIAKLEWQHAGTENATVTADLGNVFTAISPTIYDATNTWVTQFFWSANISGGSSCNVTGNLPGSRSFPGIVVHEVSGAHLTAPFDVMAHAENVAGATGTDAMTSGAASTSVAGCYIFGGLTHLGGGSPGTVTAGTGYTMRSTDTTYGDWSEGQVQSAAGSIAATFTFTSAAGTFDLQMVAFKPPTVAPTLRNLSLLGVG